MKPVDSLPPDLADLLGSQRDVPPVPSGAADRVLARVNATLAAPPTATPPRAPANPVSPNAAASAAGGIGGAATIGALGFVLGALAGALGYASVTQRPEVPIAAHAATTVLTIALDVARSNAIAPPADDAQIAPSLSASSVAIAPTASSALPSTNASADTSASGDADLAKERSLIQMARTALLEGRGDSALAALERHAREFPRGRLAEEREALTVRALAGVGRSADARARADRFRKSYPKSMLNPIVDGATSPSASP